MTKFLEKREQRRDPSKKIVVFYHANCTDGFTAAWVAWKKFGEKAEYIANFHEDEPLAIKNKQVYTLDLTFPERVTKRLMSDNARVTSIDHHLSTKAVTLMTNDPVYDVGHSGSTLAWKYFFPKKMPPKFLLNVEDMDLWNKKISSSRALYSYLDLFDFNFEVWSRLIRDFEISSKRKQMLEAGNLLLRYENKMIERHVNKNARLVKFEGYEVYAINESACVSETGAKLARMLPPLAIIWNVNKNGIVLVSLRGTGQVDLSLIAKKYGGGGHKNSAAFRLASLKEIPWQPI